MGDRLSDEELEQWASGGNPIIERMAREIQERRAQDLTGEGQAALEWLNDEVRYMIEDREKDERWRKSAARALATLSKLLTRGNR